MSIDTHLVVHTPPQTIKLAPVYVVAWLANASGVAIAIDQNTDNLVTYIRTELFHCADEAWSRYDRLQTEGARFLSYHDQRGESMV